MTRCMYRYPDPPTTFKNRYVTSYTCFSCFSNHSLAGSRNAWISQFDTSIWCVAKQREFLPGQPSGPWPLCIVCQDLEAAWSGAEPAKNLRCHARMTRQWGTPHGYFQGNMIHDGIWGSSIFRHTHVDMVVLNSMMFGPEKSLRGSVWGTVRQAELSCCPPLFGPREPANDILVFNNIYIP